MESITSPSELSSDDFVRRFALRPGQLMWLLGAGASVSAGIPSAWDMIWQFKQTLFVAQRKASPQSVADLGNPAIRALLDSHIASSERLPSPGSPDEYAALFEATYPVEREDACARTYGTTGTLSVVALDAPELAGQLIGAQKWPIAVKLHGDFRSRRLKNTTDELRQQDAALRQQLVDACRRSGLVVAGYSGRDDSVMDALETALNQPGGYPGGLFWLHRGSDPPLGRVIRLLQRASDAGVECGLVRIESFDEILRDLVRLLPALDTSALNALATGRSRVSGAPEPSGQRGWPLIRLNGLAVTIPANCRKLVCTIEGVAAARSAVAEANARLIVTRTQAGVLGFGSDAEFRRVFDPFGITAFDLATFEKRRLRYESGERGLLRDALVEALCAAKNVRAIRRRSADLLVPVDPADSAWDGLRAITHQTTGTVPKHPDLKWHEGVGVRLDWADDGLWLLLDPKIVFEGVTDATKAITADFARERTVKRYNRDLDRLIDFWAKRLAGEALLALSIGDGIDARFAVGKNTAFSKLVQP
ncbi:SIR2 family protein [Tardibacter chloracetimidivorans]|uniref:SIR2 family protein n=1 Tax=Tardibacter chloracetimidivorans TaxID=1921510 RepID=A0A1L3ZXR6_9SPHN|nr:SIR2 family protein [Tardibacter chloracetimidivorans]